LVYSKITARDEAYRKVGRLKKRYMFERKKQIAEDFQAAATGS
jgi:hypothetical protein